MQGFEGQTRQNCRRINKFIDKHKNKKKIVPTTNLLTSATLKLCLAGISGVGLNIANIKCWAASLIEPRHQLRHVNDSAAP